MNPKYGHEFSYTPVDQRIERTNKTRTDPSFSSLKFDRTYVSMHLPYLRNAYLNRIDLCDENQQNVIFNNIESITPQNITPQITT